MLLVSGTGGEWGQKEVGGRLEVCGAWSMTILLHKNLYLYSYFRMVRVVILQIFRSLPTVKYQARPHSCSARGRGNGLVVAISGITLYHVPQFLYYHSHELQDEAKPFLQTTLNRGLCATLAKELSFA